MSPGYSAVQTARLVSALRWVCGRLSEIVGVWASEAAAAADGGDHTGEDSVGGGATAAAVEMLVLSRRLASHREVLDGLQPDSERLASWRQAAPGDPSLAGAIDEIAALPGPLERLAVAREVLVPQLLDAYRSIGEHAAPHCDAALASAVRALRHDLDRGAAAAGAGQPSAAEAGRATRAAEVADRVLAAAGSIVEPYVLRPDDWA